MRNKICYIALLIVVIISGCSKSTGKINISDFQCIDGEYRFQSIPWGSSMQETEAILGYKLEEAKEAAPGTYKIADKLSFLGIKGEMYFYFEEGELADLSFRTVGDETLEEFYLQVSEEFSKSFGISSNEHENTGTYAGSTVKSTVQRWDGKGNTSLQVILAKGEPIRHSITIGILKSK